MHANAKAGAVTGVARALALGLLVAGIQASAHAGPLDQPDWVLVARMADDGPGMFDGNGDLRPDYSFGTFTGDPLDPNDYYRPFPVTADEILFISGDGLYWAIADYNELRAIIDALGGEFGPNIDLTISINGGAAFTTMGNVLSRAGGLEDPWISMQGGHFDGLDNGLIIWGENDFDNIGTHEALKQAHKGVNVYVRAIPEAAVVVLLGLGLAILSLRRRRVDESR